MLLKLCAPVLTAGLLISICSAKLDTGDGVNPVISHQTGNVLPWPAPVELEPTPVTTRLSQAISGTNNTNVANNLGSSDVELRPDTSVKRKQRRSASASRFKRGVSADKQEPTSHEHKKAPAKSAEPGSAKHDASRPGVKDKEHGKAKHKTSGSKTTPSKTGSTKAEASEEDSCKIIPSGNSGKSRRSLISRAMIRVSPSTANLGKILEYGPRAAFELARVPKNMIVILISAPNHTKALRFISKPEASDQTKVNTIMAEIKATVRKMGAKKIWGVFPQTSKNYQTYKGQDARKSNVRLEWNRLVKLGHGTLPQMDPYTEHSEKQTLRMMANGDLSVCGGKS